MPSLPDPPCDTAAVHHVLQIITTLEAAGAQVLLLDVAARLDPVRFRTTVAFLHRGEALSESARARGIPLLDLSRNGRFDPLVLPRLIRWMREEQVDLIHTHLVHAGVIGKLAALAAEVPAVTTRHYGLHEKRGHIFYRIEDRLTRSGAATIAVSESIRETLLAEHIAPKERIHVIPNGIDLSLFHPDRSGRDAAPGESAISRGPSRTIREVARDPLNARAESTESEPASQTNCVIGSVGRLEPEKGMDSLLAAGGTLARQGRAFRIEIVGEGSQRAHLREQMRSLELEDRVRFLGFVERNALPGILRTWDIVVQPSRKEAFGIAAVEAMAMAKCVVATNTEGIPEIVSDGETGRLVAADNPESLARVLAELLDDAAQRATLGGAARTLVERRYSIENTVSKLETLYAALL